MGLDLIRADERHEALIFASWLKSYKHAFLRPRHLGQYPQLDLYPPASRETAERLLDQFHEQRIQSPEWLAMRDVATRFYYAEHHLLIDNLMKNAELSCPVLAAVHPNAHRDVMGWVCYSPGTSIGSPVIHYVHVKEIYRRLGIAQILIKRVTHGYGAFCYSHATDVGRFLAMKMKKKHEIQSSHTPRAATPIRDPKDVTIIAQWA
jgi:hypothetical protein